MTSSLGNCAYLRSPVSGECSASPRTISQAESLTPVQPYWTHLVPHPVADRAASPPKLQFGSEACPSQTRPHKCDQAAFMKRDYFGWFYFQLLDFAPFYA